MYFIDETTLGHFWDNTKTVLEAAYGSPLKFGVTSDFGPNGNIGSVIMFYFENGFTVLAYYKVSRDFTGKFVSNGNDLYKGKNFNEGWQRFKDTISNFASGRVT